MASNIIKRAYKRVFQKLFGINHRNWSFYLKLFPWLEKGTAIIDKPILGKLAKKITMMSNEDRDFSQGYIVSMNHDINYNEKYKNSVLPIDLIKKAISGSSFRAIMNTCYCRDSLKCKNYPIDFGCVMIGEGARSMVERGIAREVSIEEALEHTDKAADMGLIAMCLWIEIEAFGMGVAEEDHYKLMEVCYCCPCCCIGLRNFKNFGNDIMKRFSSIGWVAASKDGCKGCKKCAKVCPTEAITVYEDYIAVSNDCLGCGICASKCPYEAIEMIQVEPFKDNIQDYFKGFRMDI